MKHPLLDKKHGPTCWLSNEESRFWTPTIPVNCYQLLPIVLVHCHSYSCCKLQYTYFNRQHFFLHKIISETTPARVRGGRIVRFFWLSTRKKCQKTVATAYGTKCTRGLNSDVANLWYFMCFFLQMRNFVSFSVNKISRIVETQRSFGKHVTLSAFKLLLSYMELI